MVALITAIAGRVAVGAGLPFMLLIFGPVLLPELVSVFVVVVVVEVLGADAAGGGGGGFSSDGGEVGHRAKPSKRTVVACMI